MTKKTTIPLCLSQLLCVLFFLACLPALLFPAPGGPATPKTLRIGIPHFPTNLNPLYVTDEVGQAIANKVYHSLFFFDGSGTVKKGLVKSTDCVLPTSGAVGGGNWEVTLELKKNIYFSNGEPLTADDVIATFERTRDQTFGSPYMNALNFIHQVEQLDRYRLKLIFRHPFASWRHKLTLKILNARQLAQTDGNPAAFKTQLPLGSGPYRFDSVKEPSELRLALNSPPPSPSMYQYLEYSVVPATYLAPLKLIKNEIDICELQPNGTGAYNTSPKWQKKFAIQKYKKFGYTYLVFNLRDRHIPLNVRRIFYNLLVDGNFLERFLEKKGEPVKSPFLLLNDSVETQPFPVQPLASPFRLKILTNSESKFRKNLIFFLAQKLKPYNIILEQEFLEYHSFLKSIKAFHFDIAVSGFLLDIDYDMKSIFATGSYYNYAGFKSAKMDRLLEAGLQEPDEAKRKSIYLQAHELWLQELPLLPLLSLYYYMGISRQVKIPETTTRLMSSEGDFLLNITHWKTR